jgi:NitT/TauT family transport system substrate-binding protein
VQEDGGKILVNEKDLWSGGKFPTTLLVVRTAFLNAHPDVVKKLLEAQVKANDYVNKNSADAQRLANQALATATGKPLGASVLSAAWQNLTFTDDPLASAFNTAASHAEAVGLLAGVDLTGIFDLTPLNDALKSAGESTVKSS